ncbi:MAG: PAS domain S-box protein, partial [Pseudomonadales bacterium]
MRLLIAERSENAAHQFDSLLRDAGIATRLEIIDLPMAMDKLAQADLMLCNAALPQLIQLLPTLASSAPQVPIIVVNNDEGSLTQSEAMELGAADVVSDTEGRHLVLVVQRELEHVCQNIQFKQALKSLNEAEQRCRLLLQSSRAAIAYVHEGMHIYANEGYLKLFGFEDSDDLLGLPLIDLLDRDSADALKAILKQFRDNEDEDEIDLDFSGTSTDGATISGNIALAAAEYEGEHCLQVTVRTSSPTSDTAVDNAVDTAAEDSATEKDADAEVPVLREDAIVGNDDPTVGQANGASTDTASAAQAVSNGADADPESDVEEGPDNTGSSFSLELMEEPADQSG